MNREQALEAIRANVKNQNMVKHMLATEAIMRALARRLGGDEEEWGLAGLLHDIDIEVTGGDMSVHSKPSAEMVRKLGASETVARAILCHNYTHGAAVAETVMEKALICTDPLTGLITAGALIRPDKKLEGLAVSSLLKRFGEKRFAAGASREHIAGCRDIGLELEEFVSIGLVAMQGIAGDLGL